jgi:uridine kinase
LGRGRAEILAQDHYYHDQSAHFDGDGGQVNFDHPSAIDFELFRTHLECLQKSQGVAVPRYDFSSHTRLKQAEAFEPKPIIILDGTLILAREELRPFFFDSVFLEVPQSLRFERRLQRDTKERGRCSEGVYRQFFRQVKPMHDQFVEPSKKFAKHLVHSQDEFDEQIADLCKSL